MAASGFTPISLYYSTTASAVPTSGNLANGELGLNIADMKLYAKNSAGTVTLLASNSSTGATVSSVAVSGGTTGLTTSGGPITSSGTITFAGTLATTNGGTGLTSFTSGGVVYASSSSALATGSVLSFDGTNLGIGTSSPSARLQINGTTDATQRIIVGGTGNTSSYKINYNGSEVGFIQNYQNTEMSVGTTVAASLGFNTNNTQRFVITSAGALGIGASPSYGTSGQVLTSGGSSAAPTWATASGGDSFTAVASGTISNGRMVNLKSDGTVEMVAETTVVTADAIPAGSTTQFNSGNAATRFSVAWANNSSTKFILVYFDTGTNVGKAVLGTVSDTTITFGTVSDITSSGQAFESPSVCAHPQSGTSFVIVWRGVSERGRAVVATISGNNLSIGAQSTFTTSTSVYATCVATVWGSGSSVVASYFDNSNGNYATLIAGTISGNDVTWGARTVADSNDCLGATSNACSPYDDNSTGVVIFRRNSNGNGYAKCFSVSGNSVTVQASVATWTAGNNANSDYTNNGMFISGSFTASATYAVVNKDDSTSYGYIYGATTNFSVPTFADGLAFESTALTSVAPRVGFSKFSPSKLVVSYAISSATYAYSMTMSGYTITFSTKNTVYAGTSIAVAVGFNNNATTSKNLVMAYRGASNVPYAVIGTIGFSTTTNNLSSTLFVGASAGDYANGATATILVKGAVSTAQTGLTVNSTYYLQTNGTLSTTPASPSVLAGRALAATKILVGTT